MSVTLELPPAFRAITLREHRDAFVHAKAVAAQEGAGTLVWVRRFDTVELAVVLEPEEPLEGARRALYAVACAIGDALAALAPPEKVLQFIWPDTIMLDGALVGGLQLGWPEGGAETESSDWLVAGLIVRTAIPLMAPSRPGGSVHDVVATRGTSLELEGFELIEPERLIESFARHLMLYVDMWQSGGFKPLAERYLAWLPEEKLIRRGIDGNGDLLMRNMKDKGLPQRSDLKTALAQPQWLDPSTGTLWL